MDEIDELRKKIDRITKELEEIRKIIEEKRAGSLSAESTDSIKDLLASMIGERHSGGAFMHAGVIKEEGSIVEYWSHTFTYEEVYSIAPKSVVGLVAPLASEQRIAILRILLKHGQVNVARISKETGLEGGELYHHLKELLRRGFIRSLKRGVYAITTKGEISLIMVSGLASWLEPSYGEL